MHYLYILQSLRDGSTYIGSCKDLRLRVSQHNKGKTKSIKNKLPVKLVYYEAYLSKTLALKRERQLKNNSYHKERLFVRIFDKQ